MKIAMGVRNYLYPIPVVVVGANVAGQPNYATVSNVGILDFNTISLGMGKVHYTNRGIKENQSFSINLPSASMVEKVDYCGLVSGHEVDKSQLFKSFYGELETAPMISSFPINMECRLLQAMDFPKHDIFIGEIVQSYGEESLLVDGALDFTRIESLLFVMNDTSYWRAGPRLARAWQIGKIREKSHKE